jgi:hypothetical protein
MGMLLEFPLSEAIFSKAQDCLNKDCINGICGYNCCFARLLSRYFSGNSEQLKQEFALV